MENPNQFQMSYIQVHQEVHRTELPADIGPMLVSSCVRQHYKHTTITTGCIQATNPWNDQGATRCTGRCRYYAEAFNTQPQGTSMY